jgi:hypothetical protein
MTTVGARSKRAPNNFDPNHYAADWEFILTASSSAFLPACSAASLVFASPEMTNRSTGLT